MNRKAMAAIGFVVALVAFIGAVGSIRWVLKQEYRMPSYAGMPENERHTLASYLASLKVRDWYLEQTRQAEYEKLTGMEVKK